MTDSKKTCLVYLYGTLMKDGCRSGVMSKQKFIGEATTKPAYALLDLRAFPGLVRVEEGGKAIRGELWEVDSSLIPTLDRIECAPSMYRLEEVELEGVEGPVSSYFYQLRRPTTPVYEGDRWDNNRA